MGDYELVKLPETILEIETLDGIRRKYELLTAFRAENNICYFAVLPWDDNEDSDMSVELVRATIVGTGEDYQLEPIESDEEFDIAYRAFDAVMNITVESDVESEEPESDSTTDVITLPNSEGGFDSYIAMDLFECNDITYIALASEQETSENEMTIRLMRYVESIQNGEHGFELFPILSDGEYESALKVFENRMLDS